MNAFHEYALLVVVAAPVVAIVAMNVMLRLAGERGTLLLPGLGAWPSSPIEMRAEDAAPELPAREAANDSMEKLAA